MPDLSPRPWQILGQDPRPTWLCGYPKIARLHALARQGLPVPRGWIHPPGGQGLTLPKGLAPGPWILRSVMPSEDGQSAKLTGLSRSVPNIFDQKDLQRAQQDCEDHLATLQSQGLLPQAEPRALAWLLQTQIQCCCLVIAMYDRRIDHWYLEFYAPGEDPFSGTQSPIHRGDAQACADPALFPDRLRSALSLVLAACTDGQGLEVEMVLDSQGHWHCVQAKALARGPAASHREFLAAANAQLQAQGRSWQDFPRIKLDAEHNPEPLSPAHIWLMSALATAPRAPGYVVLCGWLYEIQTPSSSCATSIDEPPSDRAFCGPAVAGTRQVSTPPPKATLDKLSQELLPKARGHQRSFDASWPRVALSQIPEIIDDALARCRSILASRRTWVDKVRAQGPKTPLRTDYSFSATLSDKAAYADVLPTRWDISAPSLDAASLTAPQAKAKLDPSPQPIPLDHATQWALLDEWDDHLFALALHVVRQAWLKIASSQAIPESLIFFADKTRLTEFSQEKLDKAELIDRCETAKSIHQAQCELNAPALLLEGRPALFSGASRWHGLGIGPQRCAKLYKRRDLAALLADPPPRSSILAMPALTAPAALALHRLEVRAVVTQYGGIASHGARMAAELGLSALIGCHACMELPEGASVWLDTKSGRLWQLPDP